MNDLFDYKDADFETTDIQFLKCKMKKDFANVEAGSEWAVIIFYILGGILEFYETTEDEPTRRIKITITPVL